MKINIGSLQVDGIVFLAPMAGITDVSFRILCRERGCALAYTEMVSAKGLLYNGAGTKALLDTGDGERPVGVQLFGSDPGIMADMAEKLSQGDSNIDLIDINMGCPAGKIVKNGEGSALMKNPALVGKIIKAVAKKSKVPVTVKIRKGFDDASINAVEIGKIAEEAGAAAITVHGRTREQQYSGVADWEIIAKVKASVGIPVIGNGDVISPQTAKKILDETGCDGIMVGRAAQGNPWLFHRINHYLQTGQLLPEPDYSEKIAVALGHARMLTVHKGEYIGIREMRRHLGFYIKGTPGAAELRGKINNMKTYGEMERLLQA